MRKTYLAARTALAAALCLCPALAPAAADDPAARPADKFSEMDINRDGRVIVEEFRAAFPNMSEKAFAIIDKSGDGAITREEWNEFVSGHARGMTPGNMPGQGAPMNTIPGDPLIPPMDSADLPLVRPPDAG